MFFPKLNRVYCSILSGAILSLVGGISFSWSSPLIPKLNNNATSPFGTKISVSESSWISSLVALGAALGPFICGYISSKIGKRITLLYLGLPLFTSYMMLAFGRVVTLFYIARFVIGFAIGGSFAIFPYYIAEMSNKENRGSMMSIMSCTTCFGILFPYCLGPYVSVMLFNLVIAVFPAIFMVLFFLVGEESPRYHLNRRDVEKARKILQIIRGTSKQMEIELELEEMKLQVDQEPNSTILDIFRSKALTKTFFVSLSLFVVQQGSGINAVYFYSQTVFEGLGTSLSPEICSIILGVVQFLSSFITPIIIDSLGRKISLTISCVGMTIAHVPFGIYVYLRSQEVDVSQASFVPILTLTVFMFAYNSGVGFIPWILLGELFPDKVQAPASSVISSINWIMSFCVTKYFELFIYSVGLAQTFWLFAACCFVSIFLINIFVVETKGKSLEEIQVILNK